jgi:teichuronic acid biosynthesis glycosyltransferase TuaC
VRALIVTNMYPTPANPVLGSFVRDQVEALRRIPEVSIELFAFTPGSAGGYVRAAAALRNLARATSDREFDIVHAHFGLSAWPSLAMRARGRVVTLHGTDLAHPRSRLITLGALRFMDLTATVSAQLAASIPGWAGAGEVKVLPTGVDTRRFAPIPREQARAELGLDPAGPYLLFAADPARSEKRHDRARAVAGDAQLLTLGEVEPERVPLWVNAANAVLVPSEREGFGLAVLEALACNVPVLATPCGIAPQALAGIEGTYCGRFDASVWREQLRPALTDADPRVSGRERAEELSCDRMAQRVLDAWRHLLSSD